MTSTRTPLPIDAHLSEVLSHLGAHPNLVLIASPGAGKTTRVPVAIWRSGLLAADAPGVLMLEPRRLAARAAAARMARENGGELGAEIGYQVRFDNRTSERTRLTVITEGLLSRKLARDPRLSGIGCVILDEFHERSWHTDLGLGLLRELQQLARPDLKIVVMSATLRAEAISAYLGDAPIVDVKAEAHPVTVHLDKAPQLLTTGPEFVARVGGAVIDALAGKRESPGDLLVFLPGMREIAGTAARIAPAAAAAGCEVHLLHGSLKLEDQDRAIRRSGKRKIILATNIAETSLTIDGVATVIDAGLARVARLDATGFPRLELARISRFSATQRAGRAGRQRPGVCHRLWTKLDESSMNEMETPEILRVELAEAVLLLAALGITDPGSFSWFEKPAAASLAAATALLDRLQAIEIAGEGRAAITALGESLLDWPLHPRLARVMEAARGDAAIVSTAAKLCALITEKDILADPSGAKHAGDFESDVVLRLEALEGRLRADIDRAAAAQVRRAAEQIEKIAAAKRGRPASSIALDPAHPERELLLLGYPDRVARRRRAGEPDARMIGGKGVKLGKSSCVELSELFVAIDAAALKSAAKSGGGAKTEMTATIASGVELAWLKKWFPTKLSEIREPALDASSGRVLLRIFEAFEDLPLEEPRLTEARREDVADLLPDLIAADWPAILERNEGASAWIERYEFLRAACPEKPWPGLDFADPGSPAVREMIAALCLGESAPARVAAKDFTWHLENAIGREAAALLGTHAPETIMVPTGNRMKVRYPRGRSPYIETRIQEVFGWKESPTVAEGRVRVVLHLLGPNFRPVQVTSDLSGFWANGYAEVRKELRARYPKHSWPEDPLTAAPQAKGGRRT